MKLSTQIIKELMLPHLINDEGFNHFKINENDWDELTEGFVKYSIDTKPLYKSIYALNLNDPESIIDTTPEVYESFIEEIAEQYVLKNNTDASEYLLKNKVSEFLEHLEYLSELQNAITAAERKNLKIQIPEEAGFLDFDIPDEDLEQSIKKNAREDLKDKMHQWDQEMTSPKRQFFEKRIPEINSDDFSYSYNLENVEEEKNNSKGNGSKTYFWIKYSIAASLVLAIGIYFFKDNYISDPNSNKIVDIENKSNIIDTVDIQIPTVNKTTELIPIITQIGLGYTNNNKINSIKAEFIDFSKQKTALQEEIRINSKLKSYFQNKLDSITELEGKYIFDENVMTFYGQKSSSFKFILFNNQLYLASSDTYFKLFKTDVPINLTPVNEYQTKEQLEKIIFENE